MTTSRIGLTESCDQAVKFERSSLHNFAKALQFSEHGELPCCVGLPEAHNLNARNVVRFQLIATEGILPSNQVCWACPEKWDLLDRRRLSSPCYSCTYGSQVVCNWSSPTVWNFDRHFAWLLAVAAGLLIHGASVLRGDLPAVNRALLQQMKLHPVQI